MEKTINIGIIGVGGIGERFLQVLENHPRAKVLGLHDTNMERLNFISDKYNIPFVTEYEELLENKDIDVIYLAVPPKYHHPIAFKIIEKNKHFICEKPLANSTQEAMEMAQEVNKYNIVHAINFPTIYSAAFDKLTSLLDDGFIGNLRRVEFHGYFSQWPRPWQQNDWIASKEQGGFIREVFSHYIQIIQRLFSKLENIETKLEYPQDPLASEIGVMATANLSDGTPVLLNSFSEIGMEENLSLTIYGTEGTISLVNWRELWTSSKGEKRSKVELPEQNSLFELISDVFSAIDGKTSKVVTFDEGRDVQIVIEKLLDRDA